MSALSHASSYIYNILAHLFADFCLCSKGIQRRTVKCKRKEDGSIVTDAVCKKGSAVKPEDEKPCNTQPCPPEYVTNTPTENGLDLQVF